MPQILITAEEQGLIQTIRKLFPSPQACRRAAEVVTSLLDQGLTRPGSWEADCLFRTELPRLHEVR